MSLKMKISSFFGLDDENYMDDDPYFNQQSEASQVRSTHHTGAKDAFTTRASKKVNQPTPTAYTTSKQSNKQTRPIASQETAQMKHYEERKGNQASQKVVTMQPTSPSKSRLQEKNTIHSSKIIIVEPKAYSEAMIIAKHVIGGESVLVNFHLIDEPQARRIVDFLTGAVYAEDGDIKRVADEIFLCTPKGIEIDGTAQSLVDNNLFDL